LQTLTDDELSALSTMSTPIGAFLHARGPAFSVLPEAMLAEQCREELERRKFTSREGWRGWYRPAALLTILGLGLTILIARCSAGV
jgi:hypothetical protein